MTGGDEMDAPRGSGDRMKNPRLPIRRGMDVYDAYHDRYIGAVVRVWRAEGHDGSRSGQTGRAMATGRDAIGQNPPLVHEEGNEVSPTEHQGSTMLGEEMGPFPTMGAGNTGPVNQSAARAYATGERESQEAVYFAVRPGRMNLGPLTRPFYVPTSAVLSISMDVIVLDVKGDEIPQEWRKKPDLSVVGQFEP